MKTRLLYVTLVFVFALAIVSAQGNNNSLIQTLLTYQAETHHGAQHVERWTRALAALGHGSHANPMTASEAQDYAQKYQARRWQPVANALRDLESSQTPSQQPSQQPSQTAISNAWDTAYGPSWVDGTNCFWWVDTETVKVREFSSINDWIDVNENGAAAPAWTNAHGYYVAGNPMPRAIDFQIGLNAATRVSRFVRGGGSIKDLINKFGQASATYNTDGSACNVAHLFFTPEGNFK